jgi:hypothetical protein
MVFCTEGPPVTLRLQICRDNCGSWSVYGLSPQPARQFPSLSATVAYARRQCGAAPATIELMIDGCCAIVHQREGWPRELVGSEAEPLPPKSEGCDPEDPGDGFDRGARRALARWRSWIGGA